MSDVIKPAKELPFFRSGFNYDTDYASEVSGLMCEDQSLAQQQFKEETDINTIVQRFGLTGELPENLRTPDYGDFTSVVDYQSALNIVIEAQDAFQEMPGHVRARFDNNPQKFLEFAHDPANRDEAKKLGLLLPEKAPEKPLDVRVIPDTPPVNP